MRLVAKKVVELIAVVLAVTALSFLLLNLLPGDPAVSILGSSATPRAVAALHHDLGLDQPVPVRYGQWMARSATGDLGRSYLNGQPVLQAIRQRLPVTLE